MVGEGIHFVIGNSFRTCPPCNDAHTCGRKASESIVGRFNEETFIVAPGSVPAPSVHNNAFPDAILNPITGPIHTFHLGLWFNSPDDAVKAGCSGGPTPFNGEHNAGPLAFISRPNPATNLGPLCRNPDTTSSPARCNP